MLQAKALSYQYKTQEKSALEPISFSIPQGQIWCIVGQSGSGKTTLLKLLAGILQPTTGQVLLNNKLVLGPAQKLVAGHKDIQLVEQDFNLMPFTKVFENINQTILALNETKKTDVVAQLTQFLGIDSVQHKKAKDLSGGQKQRVAIAKALASKPQIILFDEPFSNLDMIAKNQLIADLKPLLKAQNSTAIFVLHQPEEALELANKIMVIDHGKLIETGSPQEIYDSPKYLETAQLFGLTNVLSQKDAQSIFGNHNFHSVQKQVIIRPHQIKLNQLKHSFTVEQSIFKGAYFLNKIKVKNCALWVLSQD